MSPVPSAASFYVPSLPDIHQDPEHPLTIFAGHLSSDPNATKVDSKTVTAHLYFVMIKNRRVADKKRIMFWFNVRTSWRPHALNTKLCSRVVPDVRRSMVS